ncbi:hypothetical protein H2279_05680 [Campylobacter sp. B0100352/1]|uniref:hypothetical protein n=1 Tax=Campylobacter sp. B0100352/1 TaxID=2735783 RepID=UPI001D56A203|nr:hypothetical protein [Campylobacter sp. B0100352/1]
MNELAISELPSNWIDTISYTIENTVSPMFQGVHNALFSGMGASIFVIYCNMAFKINAKIL